MPKIDVSCSVNAFVGQKGRKLLIPVPIFVFFASGFPAGASCRVRVSLLSSSPLGVLGVQAIPGTLNDVGANSVESPSFDPNGVIPSMTAFPSFFDSSNLTASSSYSATYRIVVIDTATNVQVGSIEFPLSGNATPAQSVDVIFALDHTFTMGKTDASRASRLARLKAAFARGVALLRDDDTLSVATIDNFQSPAGPQLAPGPATAAQQTAATNLANGLSVDLRSPITKSIQWGIETARALSQTATLVILTDGVNIDSPGYVLTTPTLPTSALIIGENPAAIPASAATMVSSNGHYAFASAQTLGEFAIEKLLTQVLVGLGGSTFISDPEGALRPGESQSFPLHITETDRDVEVIVFSNDAQALEVRLDLDAQLSQSEKLAPEATRAVTHYESGQIVRGEGVLITRPTIPTLPDPKLTSLKVTVSRTRPGLREDAPVRFNLIVAAKTDLALDAEVSASGADLLFSASLTEYGQRWDRPGTSVQVELFKPDGRTQTFGLHESTPGRFAANLSNLQAGAYTAHFIATGSSLLDQRVFQRECLKTAVVVSSN